MELAMSGDKRRHRLRIAAVAIAYALIAWLLISLIAPGGPEVKLPVWADTLIILLLSIGFPLALLAAWMYRNPTLGGNEEE
jgi:hypothetical protein